MKRRKPCRMSGGLPDEMILLTVAYGRIRVAHKGRLEAAAALDFV